MAKAEIGKLSQPGGITANAVVPGGIDGRHEGGIERHGLLAPDPGELDLYRVAGRDENPMRRASLDLAL